MKAIDLEKEKPSLDDLLSLARKGPVLIVTPDGKEFLLSEADDFEKEVEALRNSPAFQRFLDERSARTRTIPLDEIEREIDEELSAQDAGP